MESLGIDFSELNMFDITIITIISLLTIWAFFRGFIKSLFSLLTWGGASAISLYFYPDAYDFLSDKISNEKALMVASTIGVFVLVFIVLAFINSRFLILCDFMRGGVIDRSLGFSFGFLMGIFMSCLIFFTMSATSASLKIGDPEKPGPKWLTEAKTYNILEATTGSVMKYLPENTVARIVEYIETFKEIATGEMDADGYLRRLDPDELLLMKKVMSAIPEERLQEIYEKYDGNTDNLTESERMDIFSKILDIYNESVAKDQVIEELLIDNEDFIRLDNAINKSKSDEIEDEVEDLKNILNLDDVNTGQGSSDKSSKSNKAEEGDSKAEETGYKKRNIDQLDRLIKNIEGAK